MRLPCILVVIISALLPCPRGLAEEKSPDEIQIKNSPLATVSPIPEPVERPAPAAIQESINRGVDFLLADQRPDGGWGSPERTKGLNIYAPAPGAHQGFKLAVAGLVLSALVECEPTLDPDRAGKVDVAIDRGTKWILANHERVRRAEPGALYNNWGHAYAIDGLVHLYRRAEGKEELQKELFAAMESQAKKLERYSFLNGGWGYYDFEEGTQIPGSSSNSFVTATVLVALHEAAPLGIKFPDKLIRRAINSIKRQRNPDFTYAYGDYLRLMPRMEINRPGGSLGRSQACNVALRLYGDERVSDDVLKAWLNRLFARNGWLSMGRKKPIPHESFFMVAGYFYYYGHYYAAMAINLLPLDERPYFQDHLAHILLPLQEKDGSWWDYPFYNYHQQYGTAMALYSLRQCQRD
jgi:hypothetical protein